VRSYLSYLRENIKAINPEWSAWGKVIGLLAVAFGATTLVLILSALWPEGYAFFAKNTAIFIAAIAAVVLGFYTPFKLWNKQRKRIDELEETKPTIHVKPAKNCHEFFLEVWNYGAEGEFTVQVRSGELSYFGQWEDNGEQTTRIMYGLSKRVLIAEIEIHLAPEFTIYFSSPTWVDDHPQYHTIAAWTNAAQLAVRLDITVSCAPRAANGVWKKSYRLSPISGMSPISDKVDSLDPAASVEYIEISADSSELLNHYSNSSR